MQRLFFGRCSRRDNRIVRVPGEPYPIIPHEFVEKGVCLLGVRGRHCGQQLRSLDSTIRGRRHPQNRAELYLVLSQASLFDDDRRFDRQAQAARLQQLRERNIFIGTSSWRYEGWLGQVYTPERYYTRGRFSKKKFHEECIQEYAEVPIKSQAAAMQSFKSGAPKARVVELGGAHHLVFLSNESDVLREVRSFLRSLQ